MSLLRTTGDSRAAIEDRAADFCARRRLKNWTEADQLTLDAWLAESALHRVAYLRLQATEVEIERAAGMRAATEKAGRIGAFYKRLAVPLLAAASLVLATTAGIPYLRALLEPPIQSFTTEVGGHATLRFADRTEIELNTASAIRYRMTTQERMVWLDRGEAYFRVAHNPADPFTVIAAGHRISDLGTEFLARAEGATLEVTLVKGRAQLRSEKSGSGAALLKPGDEAIASQGVMTVTKRTPKELADELSWRRGVLIFRNTPLADAVREFNRYNEVKLVIADPSIAHLKFSAELTTDDFADFLQLAESVLKLRAVREGGDILISRTAAKTKITGAADAR